MLEPRHIEQLTASAISETIIGARGYQSVPPGGIADMRAIAGGAYSEDLLRKVLHGGALMIPLHRCGSDSPYTWVLRPDMPRTDKAGKAVKYEYPRATPNILDILPRYRALLGDPSVDLWITEGAKKADALASAFHDLIVPVNENGVWGWRAKGKILDDFGSIVG